MPQFTLTGTVTGDSAHLSSSRSASFTVASPPPVAPVFGFNYDVDGGLAAAARSVGIPAVKCAKFFNSGMPSGYPGSALPAGVTWPLASVKPALPMSAADQATLASVAKKAAALAPHPMLTLWQEGENKGFSVSVLKEAHALAYKIVKEAAPGVRYGQCLMTWSASGHASFGNLTEWAATQADGQPLDWYGFDTYPSSATSPPASVLNAALSQLKAAVPSPVIAITECNYTTDLAKGITYTAGTSASWFHDAWAWAVAHDCLTFCTYFLTAHGVPWPPDAGTISELATIAAAAG